MRLLLSGYLAAVLLNLHHVALWCLPLALLATIWRVRAPGVKAAKSRRWLRNAAVIVLTLAVLAAFRTLNGLQAGASLLVVMGALKLTETDTRRDWLIVVGATLFLLLAAALDAQMLWRLPLYAAELGLICMGMYALGAGDTPPGLRALARHAGYSMLTAAPFAALLFLFVPRLAGSLWSLPHSHEATTGLTDEMTPGNISELAQSSEPVARVRFVGTPPPPEQRYWRGFVLHSFDGSTWRRGRQQNAVTRALAFSGPAYRYEISLEPTPLPVLLALDLPKGAPPTVHAVHLSQDYQLLNGEPADHGINYELESSPQHRDLEALTPAELQQDLNSYASARNPRSIELAHTLRSQSDGDVDFVNRVLDYLRHGGFHYALDPALLGRDSVDDLLFTTREGFCGHYASAFALLMRAGGVPARVVAGYQGGQWNRYGDYLLVRQSDAHAWAEVWIEGFGWNRVDPTAVVAPARLTRGADDLLTGDRAITQRVLRKPWIFDLVQAWQAANAWWQDKFVGFDFSRQQSLLKSFGIQQQTLRALALILGVGASLWLAWIGWSLRPRSTPPRQDAALRSWRLLEHKLRRAASPRAPHEGVMDFAARVARSRPEIGGTVTALARRYADLRYGPPAGPGKLEKFQRAVRLLRPVRANSSPPPMKKNSSTSIDRR